MGCSTAVFYGVCGICKLELLFLFGVVDVAVSGVDNCELSTHLLKAHLFVSDLYCCLF